MTTPTRQANEQPGDNVLPMDQERHNQVALRAYELYLERGEQSDPVENWVDAEKEVLEAISQGSTNRSQAATGR